MYSRIIQLSFAPHSYLHIVAKKHNLEKEKIETKLVKPLALQADQYDKIVLKWKRNLEAEQEKLKVDQEKW